jgi:hypothetical protein
LKRLNIFESVQNRLNRRPALCRPSLPVNQCGCPALWPWPTGQPWAPLFARQLWRPRPPARGRCRPPELSTTASPLSLLLLPPRGHRPPPLFPTLCPRHRADCFQNNADRCPAPVVVLLSTVPELKPPPLLHRLHVRLIDSRRRRPLLLSGSHPSATASAASR